MKQGTFNGIDANLINDDTMMEIVFNFTNGRHHGGCVSKGLSKAALIHLLRSIANNIEADKIIK